MAYGSEVTTYGRTEICIIIICLFSKQLPRCTYSITLKQLSRDKRHKNLHKYALVSKYAL